MSKLEKSGTPKKIILGFSILLIELGVLIYTYLPKTFTGFSVANTAAETYSSVPPISKIFLLLQLFLIMPLIFFFGFRNIVLMRKKEVSGINVKEVRNKCKTDLDALYSILKDKKHLRIASIADLFKINKDLAMEWAKILESGDLATIDYPGFGGPVVILNEKVEPNYSENEPIKSPIKPVKKSEISKKEESIKKTNPKKLIKNSEKGAKKIEKKIKKTFKK
jgi:hypothetical protein